VSSIWECNLDSGNDRPVRRSEGDRSTHFQVAGSSRRSVDVSSSSNCLRRSIAFSSGACANCFRRSGGVRFSDTEASARGRVRSSANIDSTRSSTRGSVRGGSRKGLGTVARSISVDMSGSRSRISMDELATTGTPSCSTTPDGTGSESAYEDELMMHAQRTELERQRLSRERILKTSYFWNAQGDSLFLTHGATASRFNNAMHLTVLETRRHRVKLRVVDMGFGGAQPSVKEMEVSWIGSDEAPRRMSVKMRPRKLAWLDIPPRLRDQALTGDPAGISPAEQLDERHAQMIMTEETASPHARATASGRRCSKRRHTWTGTGLYERRSTWTGAFGLREKGRSSLQP